MANNNNNNNNTNRFPRPPIPGFRPPNVGPHHPHQQHLNQHQPPPLPGQSHPAFNRPLPGHSPIHLQHQFPHQQHQNQNPHLAHHYNHIQNLHHAPLPTGPAFHAAVHAQNMYPIRTSSGAPASSGSLTSPTQAPSRELPPIPVDVDSNQDSGLSNFGEMQQTLRTLDTGPQDGTVFDRAYTRGMDMAIAASGTAAIGSTVVTTGMTLATKALQGKGSEIMANIEKNPVLGQLIQVADKLVDVGKAVPFIAPAFILIKMIIDIEQKARDADMKCNDLLERITFMVSNITVLEKVKIIDPLKVVIERMNETLKQAASLIQAYRKQGSIARRLNMSNNQNFTDTADRITTCSQDLMLSLQIQQTGDISVLTRSIPRDPQDEEARQFVMSHGGQSVINSRPDLVEEFAKKMHLTMSDQVMDQMQTNMEDMLQENHSKIETMLKENSSQTVADTIKALATEVREREAEQRLTCLQCNKEYRESANGPEACSFHKSMCLNDAYSCCGKKSPCTFSNHRAVHHCEYPYSTFFDYAYAITGFVDTTHKWASIDEKNLMDDTEQRASVGRLLRWQSYHERITKPMVLIQVGSITSTMPYFFHVFTEKDIEEAKKSVRETGKTLIFKKAETEQDFAMAEWTLDEGGIINGVRLTVKVGTSEIPTAVEVPIDFEAGKLAGDVKVISKTTFKLYKPAEPYTFPETRHEGHILRSTPLRPLREFKAKTKLPLVILTQGKMSANSEGKFMRRNADKFQGTLRIFNKATPSSERHITLAEAKAEYRFLGDQEYQEVEALNLGEVKFPISIAPSQTLEIPFEAIVLRTNEQAALSQTCWLWAMVALHKPIRVRLTFKDIEGEEVSLVQEYIHQPSNRMAKKEEEDLGFFFLDDSVDGGHYSIRVTKGQDEDNVVNVNGTWLSVEKLNKIVFQAEQAGVSEVDLEYGRDCGAYRWSAWALVDLNCRRVYGFKILMVPGSTKTRQVTASLGYAPCPIYGDLEAMEERPVKYAVETDVFPELEVEEPIHVVVDDDVDDDKPAAPVPVVVALDAAQPMVGVTKAASASVSAALAEVSKATGSLDTAVFSASMGSLERRLESLDANVARMATALEKLVDILSP